jgi:hypothetical protein
MASAQLALSRSISKAQTLVKDRQLQLTQTAIEGMKSSSLRATSPIFIPTGSTQAMLGGAVIKTVIGCRHGRYLQVARVVELFTKRGRRPRSIPSPLVVPLVLWGGENP